MCFRDLNITFNEYYNLKRYDRDMFKNLVKHFKETCRFGDVTNEIVANVAFTICCNLSLIGAFEWS